MISMTVMVAMFFIWLLVMVVALAGAETIAGAFGWHVAKRVLQVIFIGGVVIIIAIISTSPADAQGPVLVPGPPYQPKKIIYYVPLPPYAPQPHRP